MILTSSKSQPRKPLNNSSLVLNTKRNFTLLSPASNEISIGSCVVQAGARLKPRFENGIGARSKPSSSPFSPPSPSLPVCGSLNGFSRAKSFQVSPPSWLYSIINKSNPFSLGLTDSISHQVLKVRANGPVSAVKS